MDLVIKVCFAVAAVLLVLWLLGVFGPSPIGIGH